jgi:hypothetical protein
MLSVTRELKATAVVEFAAGASCQERLDKLGVGCQDLPDY